MVEDFVVFKIDMQNAFNLVSRQAVLDECATSFPEHLPMGYMVLWYTPLFVAPAWSSFIGDWSAAG